jgi:hypothetical protein
LFVALHPGRRGGVPQGIAGNPPVYFSWCFSISIVVIGTLQSVVDGLQVSFPYRCPSCSPGTETNTVSETTALFATSSNRGEFRPVGNRDVPFRSWYIRLRRAESPWPLGLGASVCLPFA